MKNLILYYSYGGNTKKIAKMIQKKIGGDIAEIKTVKPYTGSYNDVVQQGQREVEEGFLPDIQPLEVNINDYDTIVLGSPVWWFTFAPAVHTFLRNSDLSDKIIYPFATNGGWIGHTFRDFKTACPNSDVKKGINIKFDEHTLKTSEKEIMQWAESIK